MTPSVAQLEKVKNSSGFIAALDQSGGSTPKALKMYGVDESEYSGEEEMYEKVHAMRTRIMTNENFTGDKILGAILFENTMHREVRGKPTARYLWEQKNVVPILKIDKGLANEQNGVQVMQPNPGLDALLDSAIAHGIFGTKMRSLIKLANAAGIKAVVDQQFAAGKRIIAKSLVPMIEPEVDIHCAEKAAAENLLRDELLAGLDGLNPNQKIILKLTLPETANFYQPCIQHPNVLKVAALSGGYSRQYANQKLSENCDMIASFSRALSEGLSARQSDAQFSSTLAASIDAIAAASRT